MKRYIDEDVNNLTKKEARAIINKKKGMTPINKKATKLANKAIKCIEDERCKYTNCRYHITCTDETTGEQTTEELGPKSLFVFEVASMIHEQLSKQIDEMLNMTPSCEFFMDEIKILLDATEALENLMMIMVLLDRAERLDELAYLD